MGRLGEGKEECDAEESEKEILCGKELYLLAVPDCLRCAQYTQDDSVVPPAVLQKSPKPAACRGYVAVHGGSRQAIDPKKCAFSPIGYDRRPPRFLKPLEPAEARPCQLMADDALARLWVQTQASEPVP
jgi:hypothetical protein